MNGIESRPGAAPDEQPPGEKVPSTTYRMMRGASVENHELYGRSAFRHWYFPESRFNGGGFRVVRTYPTPAGQLP